jgi:hypothetical protein
MDATPRKHSFRFTKLMLDGDAAGQRISKTMEFDNLQTFLNARKRFRNDMFTDKVHNNTLLTPKGRYKITEVE